MLFDQITIVGVGLIGSSIGLAAKARGVAGHVVGVGRDRAKLDRAVQLGAIDSFGTDLARGVVGSGLVVVCTPVDRIGGTILEGAKECRRGCLFTDGGSTKANIVAAVAGRLPPGVEFVPAHPLAGSEKTGAEHGRADLFVNRVTVLTPTARTDPDAVARVAAFWRGLGSQLVTMSPEDHDRALATTSHLPHAVAAAAAVVTPAEWLPLTAGGFRDTTRVAGGDPDLWAAIFLENRGAVLAAVAGFSARLDDFRRLLETGDGAGLVRWLAEAKQVRDALGT
ncbi:MAG: prephenate dehydrogenase/arogenate dehydrogenase family protein [Gemmataceae bacterium]|nr:prephenate dehydrogenase/arogenate dehydrogenase family protein [Gemmataceae bacterium]